MKITTRQLRRIIKEATDPRSAPPSISPDADWMDSAEYDKGYQDGFNEIPFSDDMSPDYGVGYEDGAHAASMDDDKDEYRGFHEGVIKDMPKAWQQLLDGHLDEGKCDKASGHEGCVRKRAKGWVVLSNKTGKPWRGGGEKDGKVVYYDSEDEAQKALGAYHR